MKLVAIEHYKFMVCYHFVERERFVISLLEETFGCVCVCVCVFGRIERFFRTRGFSQE